MRTDTQFNRIQAEPGECPATIPRNDSATPAGFVMAASVANRCIIRQLCRFPLTVIQMALRVRHNPDRAQRMDLQMPISSGVSAAQR